MADKPARIAENVYWLPVSIANVYYAGTVLGWVLVDAGTSGNSDKIREGAEALFGKGARPGAILLTHGHFDHAGSALDLANAWDVPVYAHSMEMPYLTGESAYPPADPTSPGFMAFLSRFFPGRPLDLRSRIRPLEADVPGLPDWQWFPTPGHSPGHVSYLRPDDGTLLAGDAFATVDLDNFFSVVSKHKRISRPPTPMTCDWTAAENSVKFLKSLDPVTFACGHGEPMCGRDAVREFAEFVRRFPRPEHGRYVPQPARTGEHGIVALPPPPPDYFWANVASASIFGLAGAMFAVAANKRKAGFGQLAGEVNQIKEEVKEMKQEWTEILARQPGILP